MLEGSQLSEVDTTAAAPEDDIWLKVVLVEVDAAGTSDSVRAEGSAVPVV